MSASNAGEILLTLVLFGSFGIRPITLQRCSTGKFDSVVTRRYLLVLIKIRYQFDNQQIAILRSRQCQRIRSIASLFLARHADFSDYQWRFDLFIVNHGKFFRIGHSAISLISKMHADYADITLTDESQNATLAHRLFDRSEDTDHACKFSPHYTIHCRRFIALCIGVIWMRWGRGWRWYSGGGSIVN